MTASRSAADEARDPSTSPERLLELAHQDPQLQGLIVVNPSCPQFAREGILATNTEAKQAYEAHQAGSTEEPASAPEIDAGPATMPMAAVATDNDEVADSGGTTQSVEPVQPGENHDDEDDEDDEVSVWGDLAATTAWADSAAQHAPGSGATGSAPAAQSPSAADSPAAPQTVRVATSSGVLPLGSAEEQSRPPAPATPAPVPPHGTTTHPAGPSGPAGYAAGPIGAAGAPPEADPPQDGDHGRKRGFLACMGCLILALILFLASFFGVRAWLGSDSDEYERDVEPSASQSEAPAEEPAAEETPEPDPVSPAPGDAAELSSIASPTGNIVCSLDEDTVGCSVIERDFGDSGLEDCPDGPFSISVADGDAANACGQSFGGDSPTTLEYDRSAVSGDMACTSRFDGMTCWNTITGKGFMVNRVTYETF